MIPGPDALRIAPSMFAPVISSCNEKCVVSTTVILKRRFSSNGEGAGAENCTEFPVNQQLAWFVTTTAGLAVDTKSAEWGAGGGAGGAPRRGRGGPAGGAGGGGGD